MRLHRAACALIEGGAAIEKIAARAGYSRQAAFTRAFRPAYGAPQEYLNNPREVPAAELRTEVWLPLRDR